MPDRDLRRRARHATNRLWKLCYVAENEEDAERQADRQLADLGDRPIVIDQFSAFDPHDSSGDAIEFMFKPRQGFIATITGRNPDGGWDGDVLYPDWGFEPLDPDLLVTDYEGGLYLFRNLTTPWYTPPGVGSRKWFGDHIPDREFVLP